MRPRVVLVLVVSALMATACKKEQGFDARYNEQAAQLNAAAENIRNQLNNQFDAANHAGLIEDNASTASGEAKK